MKLKLAKNREFRCYLNPILLKLRNSTNDIDIIIESRYKA